MHGHLGLLLFLPSLPLCGVKSTFIARLLLRGTSYEREARRPPGACFSTNYLSPIQPIGFGQALKNRHFAVIATILAVDILKLVTLVSTGLLGVVPTQMPA